MFSNNTLFIVLSMDFSDFPPNLLANVRNNQRKQTWRRFWPNGNLPRSRYSPQTSFVYLDSPAKRRKRAPQENWQFKIILDGNSAKLVSITSYQYAPNTPGAIQMKCVLVASTYLVPLLRR